MEKPNFVQSFQGLKGYAKSMSPYGGSSLEPGQWLAQEYMKRRNAEKDYSLRAFSRDLKISPGALSELMSGKRRLSKKMAQRIGERLELSAHQSEELLRFSAGPATQGGTEFSRVFREKVLNPNSMETFDLIAEPLFFNLLSLLETTGASHMGTPWLSRRLGVDHDKLTSALKRLVGAGLVVERGGRFYRSSGRLKTTEEVPSTALQIAHRRAMDAALEALDCQPVHLRDFSSLVFCSSFKALPEIKEAVKSFRRTLQVIAEKYPKEEVFQLSVQVIPVTRGGQGVKS